MKKCKTLPAVYLVGLPVISSYEIVSSSLFSIAISWVSFEAESFDDVNFVEVLELVPTVVMTSKQQIKYGDHLVQYNGVISFEFTDTHAKSTVGMFDLKVGSLMWEYNSSAFITWNRKFENEDFKKTNNDQE